jgi:Ca2+-binding EF-hand superfamily protein
VTDINAYATTFDLIDLNKDGLISAEELQQVTSALGDEITPEAAVEAVRRVDSDGDGLISLPEFARYMDARDL